MGQKGWPGGGCGPEGVARVKPVARAAPASTSGSGYKNGGMAEEEGAGDPGDRMTYF